LRCSALPFEGHRVCLHHVIQIRVAIHCLWPEGAVFIPGHERLVVETQYAFINFLVMLADEGSGLEVERRSLGELKGSILELAQSKHRVLQL